MKGSERLLLRPPQPIRCYGGKGRKLIGPKSSKPKHGPQVQGVDSLGKHHSFALKVQALDPDPAGWPCPSEKKEIKKGEGGRESSVASNSIQQGKSARV